MIEIHTIIDADTGEERSPEVQASFPYRTDICDLSREPGHVCPWHWHSDVELFRMARGSLNYRLPGQTQAFYEGDIGFINSGVPHMTVPLGDPRCAQQEHIFLPGLVAGQADSQIGRTYVEPLIRGRADFVRIPGGDADAPEMRRLMDEAFDAFQERPWGWEIIIRERMSRLWLMLLRRLPAASGGKRPERERVEAMLRFIHQRYGEPIALADIAASASVSPREADRVFRAQLGTTPIAYLLAHRLERAGVLLRSTDLPVTEIGLRCGFSSTSYFGRLFREKTGLTPRGFRGRERGD